LFQEFPDPITWDNYVTVSNAVKLLEMSNEIVNGGQTESYATITG
jgi:hypothetical protein